MLLQPLLKELSDCHPLLESAYVIGSWIIACGTPAGCNVHQASVHEKSLARIEIPVVYRLSFTIEVSYNHASRIGNREGTDLLMHRVHALYYHAPALGQISLRPPECCQL